ncbi:MAG: hypothetical protein ACE5QF_02335 [Thermoplasmata archaeon]
MEIPRKALNVLLAAALVAVILYVLGVPAGIIALIGLGIWIIVFIAQAGYLEGNPYKRMRYSSVPDFVEVFQYQKRQREEIRDQASTGVTVFMFLLGLVFMLVAILALLFPWNIWSVV